MRNITCDRQSYIRPALQCHLDGARRQTVFSDVHDGEEREPVACENNMFVEGGADGTGPSVCSVWNSVSSPEGEK